MTFRMATPEETKALFGRPLIFFGVKPPASWGAKSPSTAVMAPETVLSNSAPDLPRDPVEGMEQQVNARFGPPDYKDPSGVVTREEELKDGEMRIARFQHQNKEFLRLKEEGNK